MTALHKEARLHEKVVQDIARKALPKVQGRHTTKESNMAQRVSITLVDDLDGTEASETVAFGLDGSNYEIDLSDQNAKELRTRLEEFVAVARKVTGRKRAKKSGPSSKEVRQWAQAQGYPGAIPTWEVGPGVWGVIVFQPNAALTQVSIPISELGGFDAGNTILWSQLVMAWATGSGSGPELPMQVVQP